MVQYDDGSGLPFELKLFSADVSARGDKITWLHEGDANGSKESAGMQAMQVLQVIKYCQ